MYRLYVREWVVVHVVQRDPRVTNYMPYAAGRECAEDARSWAGEHLPHMSAADIDMSLHTDNATFVKAVVKVFVDVCKGEYTQPWAAEQMADINHFEDYTIVAKDSIMDREIQQYGTVR